MAQAPSFYLIQAFTPRTKWNPVPEWNNLERTRATLDEAAIDICEATHATAFRVLFLCDTGRWFDVTPGAMHVAWERIHDDWEEGDDEHPAFAERYADLRADLALTRRHQRQESAMGVFL